MTSVIQVTNVSPSATNEQVQTLFAFLGAIDSMALYPLQQDPANPITKVAFVKFSDPGSVNPAQHLTNTVFIDRALICTCYDEGIIPDENVAMQFSGPANAPKNGLQLSHVPNVDPAKLDEIQRTVYCGNIDSKNATAENLMDFFSAAGDVRFVRMAGDETQPTRFAFVEFATVKDCKAAIRMSGQVFAGRLIKINHSNNAIVKPPGMKPDSQEVSEAMRKVREAQSLISKALDPEKAKEKEESSKKKRSRSRSRSRSRRRRRSRSRDRSSRRRSRSRDRSRSSRRRRSRSRSRERSSRHRSRSSRRSRSRSRDRRRSKRSRSRSRDKRRSGSRDRKRSRRRSRSRSKKRDSKKRDRRDDSKERRERERKSKDRKSDEEEESDRKEKKESEQEEGDANKEEKKKDVSSSEDEKHENGVAENGDHR